MRVRDGALCRLIFVAAAASYAASAMATGPTFQGLGVFPGAASTRANAISANGVAVVGSGSVGGQPQAFRWTAAGGFEELGTLPGGAWSIANAVSADGSVVVGTSGGPSMMHAFRWTQQGGMQDLGTLAGGAASEGRGITADGAMVVGWCQTTPLLHNRAIRWTAQTGMLDLDIVGPMIPSRADAVSASGACIVGHYTDGGNVGFLWSSSGSLVSLSGNTFAFGVSADCTTVVGAGSSPGPGFRWTATSGTTSLPYYALAVSADGSVVVGEGGMYWTATEGTRDFYTLMQSLGVQGLSGWMAGMTLTGVSSDGLTVTGYGTSPAGREEAWIARIAPPLCRADWTRDYELTPADVGAFVTDWFESLTTGTLIGDFDRNGVVQPSDVGSFVSAWFAAVGGPCPP